MNNYSGINDISSLYNNQQQYNVPQDAIRNIPQNVTADQSQNYGIPTTQPGSSLPQGNKEEDSKSNEYYNSECFHMPIDFNLGEDVNDNCLFINNFKQQIDHYSLFKVLGHYGKVQVYVPKNKETDQTRGIAYATFEDKSDARDALDDLEGKLVLDEKVRIKYADKKNSTRNRKRDPDFEEKRNYN